MDPFSILSSILSIAQYLYNAAIKANQNQEEFNRLATHVTDFVNIIRAEVKAGTTADITSNLRALEQTLMDLNSTLNELEDQPMLKKLLLRDDIAGRIAVAYKDLSNAVRLFDLGAKLDLRRFQAENEAARIADTAKLYECIEKLQQNDEAILQFLGMNAHMQEAMMAIHNRLVKLEDSPERRLYERSLHAMQRRSGGASTIPDEFVITSLDVVIHRDKKLGEGGFAQVFKADWQGITVAVKTLDRSIPTAMFQKEINVWKNLRHPNILQFFGACAVADPPFAVCAYKSQGNAMTYLQNNPSADHCKLVYEACLGLRYLHHHWVIHGDLKASNILVDDHGNACLADFGLSRIRTHLTAIQHPSSPPAPQGTPRWMSPEQMSYGIINEMTDIYSFGMTVYEIFYGAPPFTHTPDTLLFTVVKEGIRPPRPTDDITVQRGLDDSLWGLIEKCWTQDPKHRPTAITVASQLQSSCPLHSAADAPVPIEELDIVPGDPWRRPSQNQSSSPLENRAWHALAQHEELDVDGLAQSALNSLTALKRWYTVEPKGHAAVVKITGEIVQQSEDYFGTICASIATAKYSCRSAARAAKLGESVGSISSQGLRKSLASMLHIANETSKQSENIEENFGRACAGLVQISDNVHMDLSKIVADSRGPANIVKGANLIRISPTEVEPRKSLATAQADLEQAQNDLHHLLLSASHFRNWWAKMTTKLGTLESMTPDIVHDISKSLLSVKVSRRWEEVRVQYILYAEKLEVIENLHLALRRPNKQNGSRFKKNDTEDSCAIC